MRPPDFKMNKSYTEVMLDYFKENNIIIPEKF